MEVNTVSTSPASPTEGDDLCETDVTSVAIHSVTLLICLCGLAGNGAVIGLLRLKGDDTIVIHAMAVIDFLLLLLTVPSALLLLVEDVSCSPVLPLLYLNFVFRLSVFSCYWVPFWLTFDTLGEFIKKLLKCCRRDLPDDLTLVVAIVLFWAFSALFSELPTVTFLCPSNEQEHCWAAVIAMWAIILLLLVAPMTVLVISSTTDLIEAKCGSHQQQPKRLNIVTISIGLCSVLFILCNFLQQLGYIVVPSHFFFLLTCLYSSIKPFIYFLVGGCRRPCSVESLRLSLQRVFGKTEENSAHSHDSDMDTGI